MEWGVGEPQVLTSDHCRARSWLLKGVGIAATQRTSASVASKSPQPAVLVSWLCVERSRNTCPPPTRSPLVRLLYRVAGKGAGAKTQYLC